MTIRNIIKLIPILVMGVFAILFVKWEITSEQFTPKASKAARNAYFKKLLKDPLTGAVPRGIRKLEIQHRNQLKKQFSHLRTGDNLYEWTNIGPGDVGGRTRALGIDSRDKNIIIAGGASGGLWKSIDGGQSWMLKSDITDNHSISDLIQSPTDKDIWFAISGEFMGTTADAVGAPYSGSGLFVSVDNGDSWSLQQYTRTAPGSKTWAVTMDQNNPAIYSNAFDYTSRIVINPVNGYIFVTSHYFSILRSTDNGNTFTELDLGSATGKEYYDVQVASNGKLIVAASGDVSSGAGLYASTNNGDSWTKLAVPSDSLGPTFERTVLALAPSDENILYAYAFAGISGDDEIIKLIRVDLNDNTTINLSTIIPDYDNLGFQGNLSTQRNYNMTLAVKPDDANFLLLGATNLYRFRNVLNLTDNSMEELWIGGYSTFNHHPDQHALVFDPTNANVVYNGNDGGIYAADYVNPTVTWTDLNNGFNVTQYYTTSLNPQIKIINVIGGTQDNGTPFFNFDLVSTTTGEATDISSGDGGYCFYGHTKFYVSTQFGNIQRRSLSGGFEEEFNPQEDAGQSFIHPFALEPIDQQTLYYPLENDMYYIDDADTESSNSGWQSITDIVSDSYAFTTIAASKATKGIVYLGAYNNSGKPIIVSYNHTTKLSTTVTLQDAEVGAHPVFIGLNQQDANELMVAMSNYNVKSIFHSTDGGASFTNVEGNLAGTTDLPGPSVRSCAIVNVEGEIGYVVGSSTGIYATTTLNGNLTEWLPSSEKTIGNMPVSWLDYREEDNVMVAATHGRGIFIGQDPATFISPPDSIMANDKTATSFRITWHNADFAESYFVVVSDEADFSSKIDGFTAKGKEVSDTTVLVSGLNSFTKYYFKILSANSIRESAYSKPDSTQTRLAVLSTESINVRDTSFTLIWEAGETGTVDYGIQLATDKQFNNVVFENAQFADTIINLAQAQTQTTYYYKVKANNPDTTLSSLYSKTDSVLTKLPSLGELIVTNLMPQSFDISWSEGIGAASYIIDLATDEDFNNLITGNSNLSTISTSFSFGNLDDLTTYFARVKSVNSDQSNTSNYSVIAVSTPEITSLATNAIWLEKVISYPNPFHGSLTLKNSKDMRVAFTIYDAMGRHVVSQSLQDKMVLKTSDWQPGIYLLTITSGNVSKTRMLIRE